MAKTPTEKAELFNSYFSSVFQPSTTNQDTNSRNSRLPTDSQLSEITLDVEEVVNSLLNLNVSKASGPDGIPARLLKECSHQIAPSLCTLYNHSLRSGHIPSEWKSADVTPVHKKNSKEPAANYRPISLLPIISKTLERCIYWRFYDHVVNLISPSQHGFLRNRSCVTQLLSAFHSIGQDLDKNTQTDHEKDLGITTTTKLSWKLHINTIVAKANKMLGILKRTCTSITDMNTRRTLYLSLVKSQLLYASEVWSPVNNVQLSRQVEKVQRRATKWILMNGEMPYKERLSSLNLLPLSYDRELKDLTFFYKSLFGFINVNLSNYVSFVSHGRTRLSLSSEYILQNPLCKTTTFQSSYYNRIVNIWNSVSQEVSLDSFSRPSSFKCYLKHKYSILVNSIYDVDVSCTWSLNRDCPCHRSCLLILCNNV